MGRILGPDNTFFSAALCVTYNGLSIFIFFCFYIYIYLFFKYEVMELVAGGSVKSMGSTPSSFCTKMFYFFNICKALNIMISFLFKKKLGFIIDVTLSSPFS